VFSIFYLNNLAFTKILGESWIITIQWEFKMKASGYNGQMELNDSVIIITRKGFVARSTHGKNEKQIPLNSVQAIDWKSDNFHCDSRMNWMWPQVVREIIKDPFHNISKNTRVYFNAYSFVSSNSPIYNLKQS